MCPSRSSTTLMSLTRVLSRTETLKEIMMTTVMRTNPLPKSQLAKNKILQPQPVLNH